MKKKLLLFVLMLAFALTLAISASALDMNKDGIYYSIDTSKLTATVNTQNKANCTLADVKIPETFGYDSNGDGVEETYTVTAIASKAFGDTSSSVANKVITSIVIPNTVTSIGEHAFRECSALVSVKLSSAVTYLNNATFMNCKALTTFDVNGAKLTGIDQHVFANDSKLSAFDMPSTVTKIGTNAFLNCSSLTSVNLPRTITHLEQGAFRDSKIDGDLVFDNLTSFGNHALRGTNITSLVINGTLTSLGTDASLYGCTKLEYVVLPSTVTTAGSNTFTNCSSLEYIVASENFTNISSKPPKANIIITGTNTDAIASAFSGWALAPFSEYDSATTKTIYYGAGSTKDYAKYISFEGFNKDFFVFDATTNTKIDYAPMFEGSGYSVRDGGTGFATGFKVNHDSIDAYKTILGKSTVDFGIVVFNPAYLGDGDFFVDNKINTTKGAIQAQIDARYTNCSLWISGFDLSIAEHAALELVFAGYVSTDDGIELIQKEYTGTEEAPVSSPMVSKVTRAEKTLYTVKLQSIASPAQCTTDKSALKEYGA